MSRHHVSRAPHQSQLTASAALSSPVASGGALTLRYRDEDIDDISKSATANVAVQKSPSVQYLASLSVPSTEGSPPVQQPIAPPGPAIQDAAVPLYNGDPDSGTPSLPLSLAPVPQALPNLLRYVDHDLMQNAAAHDHPPHSNATCMICILPWDSPVPLAPRLSCIPQITSEPTRAVRSTFLPLTPCYHWVHYRCFIYTTTQTSSDGRDKCFVCRIPLFQWEGLTALTLATRTGLQLEEQITNDTGHLVNTPTGPSFVEMEAEVDIFDAVIPHPFYAQLSQPSLFNDKSPDLVTVYYGVINQLTVMRRPTSRWLSYGTDIGYLLFNVLVFIRMKRWLEEAQPGIVGTEAWKAFEEGRLSIQGGILGQVHKD
jgi:hypothetical protein